MANGTPDNIIFQFQTRVTDKDDPKQLAANIETTDAAYQEAGKTVEQFDKGVTRSIANWKAQRAAVDSSTQGVQKWSAQTAQATGRVEGMGNTIKVAAGNFQRFVGMGEGQQAFLAPLIGRTEQLGEAAVETGGDMAFLKKQAEELAKVPAPSLTNPTSGLPAPARPGPSPAPTGAPLNVDLSAQTDEVNTFAAALVRLSETGTLTFDELKAAARSELDTLKAANAEASKTPDGAKALTAQLDNAQKEALDLLVTTKAIGVEERGILETSLKIANAARATARPATTGPAPTSALPVPATGPSAGVVAETKELRKEAQGANTDFKALASTIVSLGPDAQAAFDALPEALQEDERLLSEIVRLASQTPEGIQALAGDLSEAQQAAIGTLQSMGAIDDEQKRLIVDALKLKQGIDQQPPAVQKVGVAWSSLRRQMQQAKAELDALIEASDGKITPEIIAAAQRAGELQDRFEDLQATVNAFNPDKKFQLFAGAIQHVAGGFTAAQGALALFGAESQGVEKALLKVQSALAITQGLQALFGGLRDTMKNLRLLLVANAAASRTLAVAEGQAAVGATAQATATTGLSGALGVARTAALSLWATLIANPIGIIVAAIAVLVGTIYLLATAEEEAKANAQDLLKALERVSKARTQQIDTSKSQEALDLQKETLEQILALERERGKIPSSYTEQQKQLANLLIDEKIAAVQRKARAEENVIAVRALAKEQFSLQDQQIKVEALIQDLYKRGGQVYVEQEDRKAAAAAERRGAIMNVSDAEANAAIKRARVLDELNDEEEEGLKKLEEKRDELIAAEAKNTEDRAQLRRKAKNDQIQDEIDITKAFEKEAGIRQQIAQEGIMRGTIEALKREQSKLFDLLNKSLVIGSDQFLKVRDRYLQVTKQLKDAMDLLKEQEAFPVGSLADLNQELAFLKDQLQRLPEDAAEFNTVKDAVNELQAAVDALNEKLKPVDLKALQGKRLAELDEEKRHVLQIHDLDVQAAVTRAKNAGASDKEIRDIEQRGKDERIRLEIDFARKRLAILVASGVATKEEVEKQTNELRELELSLKLPVDTTQDDEDLKKKVEAITSAAEKIAQVGIQAWKAWSDAQAASLDRQIALQEQRVADAQKIADKGNAVILEKEKERLQKLTDARRKAAERNAAIAQIEAVANAVVAITRAAAEGGGFLTAVTIASTLIALTAGLVQARALATDSVPVQGFAKGTKYVDREGKYPTGVDTVPANLTRGERVVDKAKSARHRTLYDGLQDDNADQVRRGLLETAARYGLTGAMVRHFAVRPTWSYGEALTGRAIAAQMPLPRLAMRDMLTPKTLVVVTKGGDPAMTDRQVGRITDAIAAMPRTKVSLDADGFSVTVEERLARKRALRSRL